MDQVFISFYWIFVASSFELKLKRCRGERSAPAWSISTVCLLKVTCTFDGKSVVYFRSAWGVGWGRDRIAGCSKIS